MNFEELQQSWRSQPIDIPAIDPVVKDKVIDKWRKQQRRLIWSNIGITIAFIAVLVDFAWVYTSFHSVRTIFFGGSILFMSALLLVYLLILWQGVNSGKTDPSLASTNYLDHYLQKLYLRRKTMTTYFWIYSVLLWLALMFYCFDVTRGGNLLLQIGAPLATTLYIWGFMLVIKKRSGKKQLDKIDALINEMQELKNAINDQS